MLSQPKVTLKAPTIQPQLSEMKVVEGESAGILYEILKPEVALAIWKRDLHLLQPFFELESQRKSSRMEFSFQADRIAPSSLSHALEVNFVNSFEVEERNNARQIAQDIVALEAQFRAVTGVRAQNIQLETKGEVISDLSVDAMNQGCYPHVDRYKFLMAWSYFNDGTITHPNRIGLTAASEGKFVKTGATSPYKMATFHVGLWRGLEKIDRGSEIPANILVHNGPLTSKRRFFGWIAA